MDILVIALTAFLASGLTLFSGFGLGTLLMPVVALFFPVEVAIAVTALVHFANNIFKLGLLGSKADPGIVLENITRTKAVFDRRDIARELNRYIDDPSDFQKLLARLEASPDLVQLAGEQREGNRTVSAKYSTREMIDTEQAMIGAAEAE